MTHPGEHPPVCPECASDLYATQIIEIEYRLTPDGSWDAIDRSVVEERFYCDKGHNVEHFYDGDSPLPEG